MNNGNYESKILDAIQIVVDNAISKAQYDRTIQATVVRCEDETIGDYVVQYQDSTFHAYSYNTDVTYVKGSTVYVLVPCGDFSLEKSIVGSVDRIGPDYISIVEGEDAYEVVGVNTINSKNSFGLCSYTNPDTVILYDRDAAIDLVDLNTFAIEKYIKEANSLICGATITTKLPTEQKYKGNYGLIFSLDFKDNATEEIITRQYLVDVNKMTGNPYNYSIASRQYGIFEVDGKNFDSVKQISIYSCDFPKTEENKEDDIFISNIELCGASLLDPALVSSSVLSFITPQGTYFDDQDLDSATREIHAQVKIKGKAINNTSQLVKYYWFVENNTVSSQHIKYNRYGGAGWECLNDFTEVDNELVAWTPGSYKYTVNKSDIIAREVTYKCVAVYTDETVLSRTIKMYNYSSPHTVSIESDSGTEFYYDQGKPTLTCYVSGKEETSLDYSYVWSSVNQHNDFGVLNETIEDNDIYNNAVAAYNAIMAQIEKEQVLPGSVQNELNEYQKTILAYENKMRVENNKIYNLQISTITGFTTYKCSVYYKGVFIGASTIIITNSLSGQAEYSLVINNGNQVFKYDEEGISPAHPALENPIEILPLSFTLYDDKGRPVEINNTAQEPKNIQWYIPKNNSLIEASLYHESDKEQDENYYISNDKQINFGIKNTYNFEDINNIIKLVIKYKDKTITAYTNLTFTKEGEAGTNGTKYICKIIPNTADGSIINDYPMVTYNLATEQATWNFTPKTSGDCFKVQIWKDEEQIFEDNISGQSIEGELVQLEWSMLANNYGGENVDESNFSVNSETGYITFTYNNQIVPCNILKCKVIYNNTELYATLPIITSSVINNNYKVSLIKDTGFRYAMYTADGKEPKYTSKKPFTLQVLQDINGNFEDVSNRAENYVIDYDWNIVGNVYYAEWQSEQNLIEKRTYNLTANKNEYHVQPVDSFNGLCVNNALTCGLYQEGNMVGYIHIPVHLYINRYGNSAFNDWDGNSISTGENGDIILSPQVGAGKKNEDNSFTGVFMGSIQENGASEPEHGLFGYNKGQRTIALNSEDGSARFGVEGGGQLIIDPSTGQAILTSGNYDEKAGTGMEINLSEPSIKFGSGKFSIDKDGNVVADSFATKLEVDQKFDEIEKEVQDLDETIPKFQIRLSASSLSIPCDVENKPLKDETISVRYTAYFKNQRVTSLSVREVSTPSEGIRITNMLNGTIDFAVSKDIAIPNLINDYEFEFSYSTDGKKYTENANLSLVLAQQGKDGYQGQDGKSAYDIAVEDGFEGTEEEWLESLKGQDGAQGPQGNPGQDGANGKSAYQLWLDAGNSGTEEDYLNSLKGEDGQDGYTPEKGKDYFDGEQGYGIVASITRNDYNESYWNGLGTIGREETWGGTESQRNGCREGDIFTLIGTAKDTGNAHIIYYTSTSSSGDLKGVCSSHTIAYSGEDGTDGNGISSSIVTYQASDSGDSIPTDETLWTESIPAIKEGQYLWTKTTLTFTDGKKSTSYSVSKIGEKGQDGAPGYTILLSNEAHIVQADSLGNVLDFSGANTTITIFKGVEDITQDCNITITTSTGVTGTLTNNTYQVTALSELNGYIDFAVTYNNVTIGTSRFTLAKTLSGADSSIYYILSSYNSFIKEGDDIFTPSMISCSAYKAATTTSERIGYNGRWLVQVSRDGEEWREFYRSEKDEGYIEITPTNPNDIIYRVYLCKTGQNIDITKALDIQSFPVLVSSDGVEIGAVNLLPRQYILPIYETNVIENNFAYTVISDGTEEDQGLWLSDENLVNNNTYTLTYKFKDISGNITTIGGYYDTYDYDIIRTVIDGVVLEDYPFDYEIDTSIEEHFVLVTFTYNNESEVESANAGLIGIQPNYGQSTPWECQIYNIKAERGGTATDWAPAPEDLDNQTEVYYCYGKSYMEPPLLPYEPLPEDMKPEDRPVWHTSYTFNSTEYLWQIIKVQSGTSISYSTPVCLGQPRVTSVVQEFCMLPEGQAPVLKGENPSVWTDVKPEWTPGTCLWIRTKTIYADLETPIWGVEYLDTSWGQISKLDTDLIAAQNLLNSITAGNGTVKVSGSEIIVRGQPLRNSAGNYIDEAGNVLDPNNPEDVEKFVYKEFLRINELGIGFSTDGGENYTSTWTVGGEFDAQDITVKNLNAESIVNGDLTIGKNYENTINNGVINVYDKEDNLIAIISGENGVQVFDKNGFQHTVIHPNEGLQGLVRSVTGESETLYGVKTDNISSEEVFFVNKFEIGSYANIGNMQLKIINNGTNKGLAFVPRS